MVGPLCTVNPGLDVPSLAHKCVGWRLEDYLEYSCDFSDKQITLSSGTNCRLIAQKFHKHHKKFSVWNTKPMDLASLGPGITLYFYFVRLLAIVFCGTRSQPAEHGKFSAELRQPTKPFSFLDFPPRESFRSCTHLIAHQARHQFGFATTPPHHFELLDAEQPAPFRFERLGAPGAPACAVLLSQWGSCGSYEVVACTFMYSKVFASHLVVNPGSLILQYP